MVLENKVVNIESANEVLVEVDCNNGMLVSVNQLEREYEESLQVEELQRVKFSHGVVGGEKGLHECIG